MNKTFTVTLELEVEAESEHEAIVKFKNEVGIIDEASFDVLGEPEE